MSTPWATLGSQANLHVQQQTLPVWFFFACRIITREPLDRFGLKFEKTGMLLAWFKNSKFREFD